jgi:hypothetical protein
MKISSYSKKNTPSVFLPFLRQYTEGVNIFKVIYYKIILFIKSLIAITYK